MPNPLTRKANDQPRATADRYNCLGLQENPFPDEPTVSPTNPDPRRNGSIYCRELHEDKRKQFESLIVPSGEGAPARNIAFLMDHASYRGRGIGKTAFLNRRQKDISEDLGASASEGHAVLFAVHIIPTASPARRKFWEFAKLIGEALIDRQVISQAICRIRASCPDISEDILDQCGSPEDWEDTIGDDRWLESMGLEVFWHINRFVRQHLLDAGIEEELAGILTHVGARRSFKEAFFGKYKDSWWRNTGGEIVFDQFVKLFQAAGFTRGLLLVDELEKIVLRQNILERRTFAESLRFYLSDGDCPSAQQGFYGVVLTIHPGIQELLLPHWRNAGLDRVAPLHDPDIRQCEISFGPLDPSQADVLVLEYINAYRAKGEARTDLDPFTSDAIREALLAANLVPGPMLKLLHDAVEMAADCKQDVIDSEFIKKLYKGGKPPEKREPNGDLEADRLPSSEIMLDSDRGTS